jgi:predicted lysophospholipase L1 biosynthesis ABC-type transport system permease subunit
VRAALQTDSAALLLSPEFLSIRQNISACAFFAAYDAQSLLITVGDGSAERLNGAEVTAGYFETLGVRRVLGRTFVAEDERVGSESLRADLRRHGPELVLDQAEPLTRRVARASARTTFASALMSLFAAMGLLVASLGTYAVVTQWVIHRTKEIGIRIALGATSTNVIRLVASEAVVMLGAGVLAGCALAWRLSPVLKAAVPEAHGVPASALALTVVILAAVSGVACGIPAVRAMRVDPAVALRVE